MVVGTVNYVAPSTDVEQGAVYVFTAPPPGGPTPRRWRSSKHPEASPKKSSTVGCDLGQHDRRRCPVRESR